MMLKSSLPVSHGICRGSAIVVTLAIAAAVSSRPAHAITAGDLQDPSAEQRYETVKTLSRDWQTQMSSVLKEIAGFEAEIQNLDRGKGEERKVYFRALSDTMRAMIDEGGRPAIIQFRKQANRDAIITLVRAARGEDRGIRINATLILANVIDNSFVCLAIDELRDPELQDNGRFNLLQIVRTVASYMYKENWDATKKTIDAIKLQLERRGRVEYEKSLKMIEDIDQRLRRNDRQGREAPSRHKFCAQYRYSS